MSVAGASVKRKTDRQRAKEKAWRVFSEYIRARDKRCVTCGGPTQHAGHFIDGRHNAVLFSERGVHGQCYHCNVGLKGNKLEYFLFMERTYGRKVIDQLMEESKVVIKYKPFHFLEIAEKYKKMTEALNANHNKS